MICRKHNIDFMDPTEFLHTKAIQLAEEGKQLYFLKDGHWNENGHQYVGELLAQHINQLSK